MVVCAVVGCSNRTDRDNEFSFFRFPGIKMNCSLPLQELQRERRHLWILRINRRNFGEMQAKYSRVCSHHFISGKPSNLRDKSNPDWAPSLNMGYEIGINTTRVTVTKYKRQKKVAAIKDPRLMAQKGINLLIDGNLGCLLLDQFQIKEENACKNENEPETILPDLPMTETFVDKTVSDEPVISNATVIKQEIDSDIENDETIAKTISSSYIENKEPMLSQHEKIVQEISAVKSSSPSQTISKNNALLPFSNTHTTQCCSRSTVQSSCTNQTVINNSTVVSVNVLPGNLVILPVPFYINSSSVNNSVTTEKAPVQVEAAQICKHTSSVATQVSLKDGKAVQDDKVIYYSANCSKKTKTI